MNIISLSFLLVCSLAHLSIICAPGTNPGQNVNQNTNAPFPGFDPNMSEEELLNQLMEEINSALPEDQRESFWQEVAKETERLEQATANMSEDEKEKYLLDLITGEPGQPAEDHAEPEIVEQAEKEEDAPSAKPIPIKETKEITEVLQSIVKSIESFLDKAAAFPDFEGKVSRWVKQKRFTDWQEGQNWQSFKHSLNKLVSRLERFKEKDPKIGMKHIDALLKNEPMMQNLKQLESKLAREVPLIEMSVFAIEKMSDKTKNAITHTINTLTEGIFRLNLPEELLKILAEFDPTAKKILAEEEKAAKSASTQSKNYKPSLPTRVAGKADKSSGLALPSLDDLGLPGYAGGSGGARNGSRGNTGEPNGTSSSKSAQSGRSGSGRGTSKGNKQGEKKEEKKADKPDKPKEKDTSIKSPDIKKHVENFSKDLREAHDTVSGVRI